MLRRNLTTGAAIINRSRQASPAVAKGGPAPGVREVFSKAVRLRYDGKARQGAR